MNEYRTRPRLGMPHRLGAIGDVTVNGLVLPGDLVTVTKQFRKNKMPGRPHRGYVFTINNPTEIDWDAVTTLSTSNRTLRLRAQLELGETGTPHIQGYVEFTNAQRHTALHLDRAHVEARNGTPYEAWCYTEKPHGLPQTMPPRTIETGAKPPAESSGARSDLRRVSELVQGGATPERLAREETHTFIRYARGIMIAVGLQWRHRPNQVMNVVVLYGGTGLGKSRWAQQMYPDAYFAIQGTNDNVWFTRYNGNSTIVFNDFYGWIKYSFLLNLTDRYHAYLPVHGTQVPCAATTFVFTSNEAPDQWYKNIDMTAFTRRITHIVQLTALTPFLGTRETNPFPDLPYREFSQNLENTNPPNGEETTSSEVSERIEEVAESSGL